MDRFETQTYKDFINKHIDRLNKRFCKSNPMKARFSMSLQHNVSPVDKSYATYHTTDCSTTFFLQKMSGFTLEAIKGLILHEFGHHIEFQLIDDLYLWDLSLNKRRQVTAGGPKEYWMREDIADNFGMLVDKASMLEMWKQADKNATYAYIMRLMKKNPDYWYDIFVDGKRRYDVARVLPAGFKTIRKVKEVKQLIRRL